MLAASSAHRGEGYIPGTYKIVGATNGSGFFALSSTKLLALTRVSGESYYSVTGGEIECPAGKVSCQFIPSSVHEKQKIGMASIRLLNHVFWQDLECARILSEGEGYTPLTSLPTSLGEAQMAAVNAVNSQL